MVSQGRPLQRYNTARVLRLVDIGLFVVDRDLYFREETIDLNESIVVHFNIQRYDLTGSWGCAYPLSLRRPRCPYHNVQFYIMLLTLDHIL